MRLDVWLDVTCLFKTRSEAKRACEGGKVDLNGQPAKPHREIKEGDELEISRPFGRKQKVVVRGLAEKHLPKAEARLLYEDLTPKPTPGGNRTAADGAAGGAVRAPAPARGPGQARRRELRRLKGRG